MWDSRPGRINTAKHQIEFLEPSTEPVHSATCRAGPETPKFEKA